MEKSAEAFRTISEVSELLNTPAHVLRFWESRFSQIKPVKRAGGRRYYRPNDLALLGGIKRLLHEDGLTIRGVQKLLREQGIKHVASLSKVELPGAADTPVAPAPRTDERTVPSAGDRAAEPAEPRSWPEAPTPDAAAPDDMLLPDPNEVAAEETQPETVARRPGPRTLSPVAPGAERRAALERGEAPMHIDVPTLPADGADNVRTFPAEQGTLAFDAEPDSGANHDDRQPAAAMLRAMDTLRARDKKAELMSVYLRLVDLRDRLARDRARGG
ncbi:hypothetical protein DEA8626_01861 [Defluviimonas aquaemixtae]|uniref:HTH merR-type domain-containing protein n=1 Tax=Albidovulum aquaemixtae TaxID=1542388 RepID=A0A2R8B6Q4_9RHOB|nr:MerR family transcriptional regulator [Defluviimonas aquaemixtae]SPH18325.1 hypothetical protein DEA8626_01861 [Defluviimonas aquaemixtae]